MNALIALCLLATGYGTFAFELRSARGTTLVGPLVWLQAALSAVAAVEILAALSVVAAPSGLAALRFAAAVTTLCPLICLLGAKRPQQRTWHAVVASLWVVLALPAGQALLGRAALFDVPLPWRLMLVALIVMGVANSLFTRIWLSGVLMAAGQFVLLETQLMSSAVWIDLGDQRGVWGLALMVASRLALVAAMGLRRPAIEPLDRLWLEFRDRFGMLWALRVAERVNSAAEQQDWNVVLLWAGFRTREGGHPASSLAPSTQRVLHQNLRNLLRRFVSQTWIDERLSGRGLS